MEKRYAFIASCLLFLFFSLTEKTHAQINVADAHYCSPGSATFTTSDAGCATYRWLDRQGIQLGTGCTFTTPFIGLNQSYTVVSSTGTAGTVGYAYGAAGLTGLTNNAFTAVATIQNSYITNFQINSTTALNTVDVVYTANMNFNCDRNVVLTLKDNGGVVIGTYSPLTLCAAGTKNNLTVNIGKTLAPGNYSITVTTPASFYDEGKPDMYTGGANYTPGGPLDYGFMRFTGNGAGGNAWGGLFNWNMSNSSTSKVVTAIDDCSALVCNSVVSPLVNFDFGAGAANPGGALGAGVTTYNYESVLNENSVGDGDYTILRQNNGVTQNTTWHQVMQDHTGKPNGYYMMVNASYDPGLFYQSTVTGLCDGTYYVFSASVMNLLKPSACGGSGITPNVRFIIKDLGGAVLMDNSSGNIAATSTPTWNVLAYNFLLPPGQNSVQLILSNSNPGGCGNDLLLDDILFSPCFPDFAVDDPGTLCASNNKLLNVNLPPGYSGAQLQWEQSDDGGNTWIPVAGATSPQYLLENITLAQNGQKYRLELKSSLGGGMFGCALKSKPATLKVEDCSALPVQFIDFKVYANNDNSADLLWITAEEFNTDYYAIERSLDGITFEVIGKVLSKNSRIVNTYPFTDPEYASGIVYYRIAEHDVDGTTTRTNIIAKYPKGVLTQQISVYPNPGKGLYQLKLQQTTSEEETLTISFLNTVGQKVYTQSLSSSVFNEPYTVDISSVPAGVYLLKIEGASGNWQEKVIKE